LAKIF